MGCNSRVGTLAVTSGPCVRSFVDVFWNQKEAEAGGRGRLGGGEAWGGGETPLCISGLGAPRNTYFKVSDAQEPTPPPQLPTSSP